VVQTVECWTPPRAFEELDTAKACAIIDEIDRGMPDGKGLYSGAAAAKARAAWKVVVRHIPGKSEKHAREIISTWLTNELLIEEDYYDEERRHQTAGLRANPAKRPG
jgi:hypothetical protein